MIVKEILALEIKKEDIVLYMLQQQLATGAGYMYGKSSSEKIASAFTSLWEISQLGVCEKHCEVVKKLREVVKLQTEALKSNFETTNGGIYLCVKNTLNAIKAGEVALR